MSALAEKFHHILTELETEGHRLAAELRQVFHHFVGHGPDTPAPAEPQPAEPPAAA